MRKRTAGDDMATLLEWRKAESPSSVAFYAEVFMTDGDRAMSLDNYLAIRARVAVIDLAAATEKTVAEVLDEIASDLAALGDKVPSRSAAKSLRN